LTQKEPRSGTGHQNHCGIGRAATLLDPLLDVSDLLRSKIQVAGILSVFHCRFYGLFDGGI
jgi:hypothetical protein